MGDVTALPCVSAGACGAVHWPARNYIIYAGAGVRVMTSRMHRDGPETSGRSGASAGRRNADGATSRVAGRRCGGGFGGLDLAVKL